MTDSGPRSVAAFALTGIALALGWAPSFAAPFSDNHEGRVDARFALDVANARDEGLRAFGVGLLHRALRGELCPRAARALPLRSCGSMTCERARVEREL